MSDILGEAERNVIKAARRWFAVADEQVPGATEALYDAVDHLNELLDDDDAEWP